MISNIIHYLYFIISTTSSASSLLDFSLNSSLERASKKTKTKSYITIQLHSNLNTRVHHSGLLVATNSTCWNMILHNLNRDACILLWHFCMNNNTNNNLLLSVNSNASPLQSHLSELVPGNHLLYNTAFSG